MVAESIGGPGLGGQRLLPALHAAPESARLPAAVSEIEIEVHMQFIAGQSVVGGHHARIFTQYLTDAGLFGIAVQGAAELLQDAVRFGMMLVVLPHLQLGQAENMEKVHQELPVSIEMCIRDRHYSAYTSRETSFFWTIYIQDSRYCLTCYFIRSRISSC